MIFCKLSILYSVLNGAQFILIVYDLKIIQIFVQTIYYECVILCHFMRFLAILAVNINSEQLEMAIDLLCNFILNFKRL